MTEFHPVPLQHDGDALEGLIALPDGPGPHPAITMAHGFAGVKEHGLEPAPEHSRKTTWKEFFLSPPPYRTSPSLVHCFWRRTGKRAILRMAS